MKKHAQRVNLKRAYKLMAEKSRGLNDVAFMGASALASALLMAGVLNFSTSYHTPADAHLLPYEEADVEDSVNVRDALMEAWKNLNAKEEAGSNDEFAQTQEQPKAEAALEEVAEAAPVIQYPFEEKIDVKVSSGDTLAGILQSKHIGIDDTNAIIKAMKKYKNPRNLRIGQKFSVVIEREGEEKSSLKKLIMKTGKLTRIEVSAKGKGFAAAKLETETNKQIARAGGVVSSSFYEAGDDAGIPAPVIVQMTKAFSYDVDFQRDIKPGQELEVLFEQLVSKENGEVVGHGDLKYAAFKVKGKKMEVYKFTDLSGSTGYYRPNGESVRKALLKTPVKARISSKFGMRKHPILGYSKMHTGIDFAAPRGTPIYAAGDGKINYAGRKGGYGNYIKIKHNNGYETAYAHMSKFAKGMRNGRRVKQGQVIGYVGSTGRSTGPHLHYEILKKGKHINPAGARFRTGRVLQGKELAAFKKEKQKLKNQLATLPRVRERVAQAPSKADDTNTRN